MDKNTLYIFQSEVLKQTEFALDSIAYLNDALKQSNTNKVWYFVQNFLVSTANVSKLLWGSGRTPLESRAELRDSLDITDDLLIRSRKLRNHFEHVDERIENWAKSSKRKNFVDSNIGPKNMIGGIDPEDFLRNLDTDSMAVTFKGESYEIQPIVDELSALHESVIEKVSQPF